MPYVARNSLGQIVQETAQSILGLVEEFIAEGAPDLLAWRGSNTHVDDRPNIRATVKARLRAQPDSSVITVKDLRDLGLL